MKKLLLLFFCFPFLLLAKCENCENKYADMLKKELALTKAQKRDIWKKLHEHTIEGYKALQKSEEMVWYIPNDKIKQVGVNAIKNALGGLAAAKCKGCLIAAVISICIDLGVETYDQWNEANSYLLLSQYHFELADFLQEVLWRDSLQ